VRRIATALPTVVATIAAVITLSTGTALAHTSKVEHHKVAPVATLTGVVTATPSATPTATIATPSSDTATSTITIAVKGGHRAAHRTLVVLTMDKSTVVRRGEHRASVADLRNGDHVSVRAVHLPDGSWLALRVNASPRGRED
jgi:hypothetical protein